MAEQQPMTHADRTRYILKAAQLNAEEKKEQEAREALEAVARLDEGIRANIARTFEEKWAPVIEAAAKNLKSAVHLHITDYEGSNYSALNPQDRALITHGIAYMKSQGYEAEEGSQFCRSKIDGDVSGNRTKVFIAVRWDGEPAK